MQKVFKNSKRKLKFMIASTVIIVVLLLSSIIFTIVNRLSKEEDNMVQIAKATETYSATNPYIPNGFTHSEGTWDTGFVIKESSTGNEFVWIPVNNTNLKLARSEFTKTFSTMAQSTDALEPSFNSSVVKYGGYYVGRYEAGVGSTSGNNVGVPVCKKGATVWTNISRDNAKASAEKMYPNNDEIYSSLISSYAYDTMLTWLKTQNYSKSIYNVDSDSSSWGNYRNSSNGSIQIAGNNAKWKANNIYDIAGNVWEWTTENYGNDAVVRGGDALSNGSVLPAGTRDHAKASNAFTYTGFRVLLYRSINAVDETKLIIAAGAEHTAYIDNNQRLWMWGRNGSGEFGNGSTTSQKIPTLINNNIKFKEISLMKAFASETQTTPGFTAGIDTNGNLYTWGTNGYGQLGNNSTTKATSPQSISIGVKLEKISTGQRHCLAIDVNGNLWAWGGNSSGQLGNGNTTTLKVPTKITVSNNPKFKEISASNTHSMALDTDGNLYTWGSGTNYKLCTGSTSSVKTPSKIDTGNTRFKKIATGENYSFALDTNGNLWGCGSNGSGQLGNGSTTTVKTLTQVINNKKFKDISANISTTMAIDTSGNLWGWGDNNYGQLGNNSTKDATSPIPILNGTIIQKISVGGQFFMAIDANENVWACGVNGTGKIGNNSITTVKVPIKITIK